MIILRSSPPSPFGRQVKIAANILGLYDQIQIENANTTDAADSLRQQNPLGKVPVLITANGKILYDSRVCIEYLDFISEYQIIPEGEARFEVLTLQALGNGIVDAALLQVYEKRMRTENERSPTWVSYQAQKIQRALAQLNENCSNLENGIDAGHISIACALGYLDLRFDGLWRKEYPNLVNWVNRFAQAVPSFQETEFSG